MANLSGTRAHTNKNLPAGVIVPFGFGTVESGYLDCDGSAVSRAIYANLFAVIGVTFGAGDGSSTFNLPNLNGIFIRGTGSQVVSAKTYNGGTLGTKAKDKTNNDGITATTTSTNSASVGNSASQAHTHTWSDRYLNASPNRSYLESGDFPVVVGYTNTETGRTTGNPNQNLNHSHSVATNTVSSSTSVASSDAETKPGSLTVKYGIKI